MLLTVPIVKIFPIFDAVKNAGRNIFIDIFVSDGCLIFRVFEKDGARGSVNQYCGRPLTVVGWLGRGSVITDH